MSLAGAKLICLDENGAHGETIGAKGRKFTIGYYMACDHILTDSNAKGLHCEINCDAFGRVTIHNFSEDHPVSVNDNAITIKRPLLSGSKINILGKSYLWHFPKMTSSECEDLNSDALSTPQKQVGIPEQPPNSCPNLMLHRDVQRRFTVHNFAYCIQSDDEGNSTIDSTKSESIEITEVSDSPPEATSCPTSTLSVLAPAMEEAGMEERSVTPEPQNNSALARNQEETPKINLINSTQNKENTNSQKKKNHLSFCQQSDIVITSFSPRETGVRIEKSYTAILKPTTPRSVYSTPKSILYESNDDDGSRDFIDFSTPATSKKSMKHHLVSNSSMHLIDLTTPGKMKVAAANASPHAKSSMKSATKKNIIPATSEMSTLQESGLSLLGTPVVGDGVVKSKDTPDSVISIDSTDSSESPSVVEVSEGSLSPSPAAVIAPAVSFNITPKKPKTITTPKRTPHPLMKRAILTSAKKQGITPGRTEASASVSSASKASTTTTGRNITFTPAATPKNVANRQLIVRRQSLSTPGQRAVVKSRLYGSPSSPKTAAKSSPHSNRSSLIPSAGRTLSTSTPIRSSGVAQRAGAKTSPLLHKVRKSIGGAPLSSHISKIRKTLDLSNKSSTLETSTGSAASTSAKIQRKSVFVPSPANARARAMAAACIGKDRKSILEQKKDLPPPPASDGEKIASKETCELRRTFTLDDTDKEAKDATFSSAKNDVGVKEEAVEAEELVKEDVAVSVLNVTFSPEKPKIKENTGTVTDEILVENVILEESVVSAEDVAFKENTGVVVDVAIEEDVVLIQDVAVPTLNVTFSPEKPNIKEITESVTDDVILVEDVISEDFELNECSTEECQKIETHSSKTIEKVEQTENSDKNVVLSAIITQDDKQCLEDIATDVSENNSVHVSLSQVSDTEDLLNQIDDVLNKSDEIKKNLEGVSKPVHQEDESNNDSVLDNPPENATNSNQSKNTEDTTEQSLSNKIDELEVKEQIQQKEDFDVNSIVLEEKDNDRSKLETEEVNELQEGSTSEKNLAENNVESKEIRSDDKLETEKTNKPISEDVLAQEKNLAGNNAELHENTEQSSLELESEKVNKIQENVVIELNLDKNIVEEKIPRAIETDEVSTSSVAQVGDEPELSPTNVSTTDVTINKTLNNDVQEIPTHSPKLAENGNQPEDVTTKHTPDKTQPEIGANEEKSLTKACVGQPEINTEATKTETSIATTLSDKVKLKLEKEDTELSTPQQASADQPDNMVKPAEQIIAETPATTLTHNVTEDIELLSSTQLSEVQTKSIQKTTNPVAEIAPLTTTSGKTQLKHIEEDEEDIELTSFKEAVMKTTSLQPKTPNLRGIKEMLCTPKRQTACDREQYDGISELLQTPSTAKKSKKIIETTKDKIEPTTFTPRRSARRASMSATESNITLTPKRITKRRASMSVDTELTTLTPKQKKTPLKKRATLFEKTTEDMDAIAEEITTVYVQNKNEKETEVLKRESKHKNEEIVPVATTDVPLSTILVEENLCEVLPDAECCDSIKLHADDSTVQTVEVKIVDSEAAINEVHECLEDQSICEVVNDVLTSDTPASVIALEKILPEKRKTESIKIKCDILDSADYSYGEEVEEVKELKTVQDEIKNRPNLNEETTPKKADNITISESTHTPQKSEDNAKPQNEDQIEKSTKVPKFDIDLKIKDDFDDEKPCTSKSAKMEFNRMNLITPKSCSTPRALRKHALTSTPVLEGIKELMDTPKLSETPTRSVARSLIERGLLPRPENLNSMSVELNKTCDESLDKIFRTPRAKNIMVLTSPKSVNLKQNADSVELVHSTEYDLNTTNFDNLDEMFKTPIPSRFDDYHDTMEEKNTPIRIENDNLKNLSPEEAFDNLIGQPSAIQTPVRKMYARKLLSNSSLMHKSPFSSSDIISDLPKTDIQEWVDSLENVEMPENSEVDDLTMTDVDVQEQCNDPLAASIVKDSESIIKIDDTSTSEILANASTSFSVMDPLACSGILTGDGNATALRRLAGANESLATAPNESDISGIDLLVQSDDSMFSEPLLVSDSDTNLDKTLEEEKENTTKQNADVAIEEISTDSFSKFCEFPEIAKERKCATPHHFASIAKLPRRSLDALEDLNISVETVDFRSEQKLKLPEKVCKEKEISAVEMEKVELENIENVTENKFENNANLGSIVKDKLVEKPIAKTVEIDSDKVDSKEDQSNNENEMVVIDTMRIETVLNTTKTTETAQKEINLTETEEKQKEKDQAEIDLTETEKKDTELIKVGLTKTKQAETDQPETSETQIDKQNEKKRETSNVKPKKDPPKSTAADKTDDVESPSSSKIIACSEVSTAEKINNEDIIEILDCTDSLLLEDEPDFINQTTVKKLVQSEEDGEAVSKDIKKQKATDTELTGILSEPIETNEDQETEKLVETDIESNIILGSILEVVSHNTETETSETLASSSEDNVEKDDFVDLTETTEETKTEEIKTSDETENEKVAGTVYSTKIVECTTTEGTETADETEIEDETEIAEEIKTSDEKENENFAGTVYSTEIVECTTTEGTETAHETEIEDETEIAEETETVENIATETAEETETAKEIEHKLEIASKMKTITESSQETTQEIGSVKDTEAAEETVEDTETVVDAETVGDKKTIEDKETLEDKESLKDKETLADTKTIRETDTIKETEAVLKTEAETKIVKHTETVKPTVTVEYKEEIEDEKAVKDKETAKDKDAAEKKEAEENKKVIKETEETTETVAETVLLTGKTEPTETVEATETAEAPVTVEDKETVKDKEAEKVKEVVENKEVEEDKRGLENNEILTDTETEPVKDTETTQSSQTEETAETVAETLLLTETEEPTETVEFTETLEATETVKATEILKVSEEIEETVNVAEEVKKAEVLEPVPVEVKENTVAVSSEQEPFITKTSEESSQDDESTMIPENNDHKENTASTIEQNEPESDKIELKLTKTTEDSATILTEGSNIDEVVDSCQDNTNRNHQKSPAHNVEEIKDHNIDTITEGTTTEILTKNIPSTQPQDGHKTNDDEAIQIDSESIEIADETICETIECEEENMETISQSNDSNVPDVLLVTSEHETLDDEQDKDLSRQLPLTIVADSDEIVKTTLRYRVSDIFLDTSDSESLVYEANETTTVVSPVVEISEEPQSISPVILEESDVIINSELQQSVVDVVIEKSTLEYENKNSNKTDEITKTDSLSEAINEITTCANTEISTESSVEIASADVIKDIQNVESLSERPETLCNIVLESAKSETPAPILEKLEQHLAKQGEKENDTKKKDVDALVEDISSSSQHETISKDIESTPVEVDINVVTKNIELEHDFGHEITSEIYTTSINQEELYENTQVVDSKNIQPSNKKDEVPIIETEELNIVQTEESASDTKDVTAERDNETEAEKCSSELPEETCAEDIQDFPAELSTETSNALLSETATLTGNKDESSSSPLGTRNVEVEKSLFGSEISTIDVGVEKHLPERIESLENIVSEDKTADIQDLIAAQMRDEKITGSNATKGVQCMETEKSRDALDSKVKKDEETKRSDQQMPSNECATEQDVVKTSELNPEEVQNVAADEKDATEKTTKRRGATPDELNKVTKETTTTRRGGRKKKEEPMHETQKQHKETESKKTGLDKAEIDEENVEEHAEQKEESSADTKETTTTRRGGRKKKEEPAHEIPEEHLEGKDEENSEKTVEQNAEQKEELIEESKETTTTRRRGRKKKEESTRETPEEHLVAESNTAEGKLEENSEKTVEEIAEQKQELSKGSKETTAIRRGGRKKKEEPTRETPEEHQDVENKKTVEDKVDENSEKTVEEHAEKKEEFNKATKETTATRRGGRKKKEQPTPETQEDHLDAETKNTGDDTVEEISEKTAEEHAEMNEKLNKGTKETATTRRGGRKKKEEPLHETQKEHLDVESNDEEIAEENPKENELIKERKQRVRKRKDLNAQDGTETDDEPLNKKIARDMTAEEIEEAAQQTISTTAKTIHKASYEVIVDHAEESVGTSKRGHRGRKATPVVTSIQENEESQDTQSVVSDADPHTATHTESSKQLQSDEMEHLKTSRGRTRKPTARAQQFLEEERAKAATPKRKQLLALASGSSTPTPTRTGARRGPKPSYVEFDAEVPGSPTVIQQPVKRRGRPRKGTETHQAEEEEEESSEETTSLKDEENISKRNKEKTVTKREEDEEDDDDKPVSHLVSHQTPPKLPARRDRKPTIDSEIAASITPQLSAAKRSGRGTKALSIKSESHSEHDEGTAKSVTPEQTTVKRSGRGRKPQSKSEFDQFTEESDAIQEDAAKHDTLKQTSVKRSGRGRKASPMTKSESHSELESDHIKDEDSHKHPEDDDDKALSQLKNSSKMPARRGRKASTNERHLVDSATPQQVAKREGRGRRVIAEVTTDETHSDAEHCAEEELDRTNDKNKQITTKPSGRGRKQAVRDAHIEEEVADDKKVELPLQKSPEPQKLPVRHGRKQATTEHETKTVASPKQLVKRGGRTRKFTADTTSEHSHSDQEQCSEDLNALPERNTAKPRARRQATIEDIIDEKESVDLTSNPPSPKIPTRRGRKATTATASDTTASLVPQQEEAKRGGRSRRVGVVETITLEQAQLDQKHHQVDSLDIPEDDKKKKAPSRARKHAASKTKHDEDSDDDEPIIKKFSNISNDEKLEVPAVATTRNTGRRARTAALEVLKENAEDSDENNSDVDLGKTKNTRNRRGANKIQTHSSKVPTVASKNEELTDDDDDDDEVKSEVTTNDESEKPSTSTAASRKRHAAANRKGKLATQTETADSPVSKRGRRKAVTEEHLEHTATPPPTSVIGSRTRKAVTFESPFVAQNEQPTQQTEAPKRATRTTRKK